MTNFDFRATKIYFMCSVNGVGVTITHTDYTTIDVDLLTSDELSTLSKGVEFGYLECTDSATFMTYAAGHDSNLSPSDVVLKADVSTDEFFSSDSTAKVTSESAVHDAFATIMSSGILRGGDLSISSSTTYNLSAGEGILVRRIGDTNQYVHVAWNDFNNITPTYLNSSLSSYIAIDEYGNIVESNTPFTLEDTIDLISIGAIGHTDLATITAINTKQEIAYSPAGQVHDLVKSTGMINIYGNVFSANGSNLKLNKTDGSIFGLGINYTNNRDVPNTRNIPLANPVTFAYRTQAGSYGSSTTDINPNIWDNAGTIETVPTGKYTAQRIYILNNGAIRIQPGQHIYDSMAKAVSSLAGEIFTPNPAIAENGLLRCVIVIKKNATDLTDTLHCKILNGTKFNQIAGIGGQSVSNMNDVYVNSDGEAITIGNSGAIVIKSGTGNDNDPVLRILNNAGDEVFYINGSGQSTNTDITDNKVDKVAGKQLSTNDFTNSYKDKLDLANYIGKETGSSVHISGGAITPVGGINFNVAAGVGYTFNNAGEYVRVAWNSQTTSTTNNGDNFINIDYNGNIVITSSAAQGDLIALGYISTAVNNTVIVGYSNAHLTGANHLFNLGEFLRSSVGSLVQSGCNTAMQASPNQLNVTVGSGYIWTLLHRFTVADSSTFTKLANSSDYGFFAETSTTANTVTIGYWNNAANTAATCIVPMTAGYWKKDMISLTPEGQVLYSYGTAQYATRDEALLAPTPAVPENIRLGLVRSAALVSQQGATSIDTVIDIRPMLSRLFDTGQAASNTTVISHSDLTNLSADDHTQYHNDARGDARYYRKAELTSGALDTRYYTEAEVDAYFAALTKSSVGLSNVQNVDQTNAANITSGTISANRLPSNVKDLANTAFSINDIVTFNGVNLTNSTPTQVKASLALVKADVGLGAVQNVDTTTTLNINSSTNKRFVTDAQLTVIGNTSNTNTGDETTATIKTKLGTSSSTTDGYLTSTDWNTFNGKEPAITAGTTNQYYRGDKSFQILDKTAVGLSNVDNTSDANKPVSTATQTALDGKSDIGHVHIIANVTGLQTALDAKEPTIAAGTTSQYWRGDKSWQTLNKAAVGLGSVVNADTTTTANITDSTNKRFLTDAQLTVVGNTSGTNTGDETQATIKTKLGAATTLVDGYLTSANFVIFNNKEGAITAGTTSQYWRGDKTFQTLDKTAVGLANVDNTSDANKPISTATQTALNGKEASITAGTTGQYWRGDKSWQTLDKTAVGLANVDNTSDANKPISTATQTALNGKEASITAGTTSQYWRGDKSWQTLDKTAVGLANVANIDTTNATNITSGTLANARLTTNLSQLGNYTFGDGQLIQSFAGNLQGAVIVAGTSGAVNITNASGQITLDAPYAKGPMNQKSGFFEDFITFSATTISQILLRTVSGTGAATSFGTIGSSADYRNGIIKFATGTTSTGAAVATAGSAAMINFGNLPVGGYEEIAASVIIPTLSNAGQTFNVIVGFGDGTTALPVDGAYITIGTAGATLNTRSNSITSTSSTTVVSAATEYIVKVTVANVDGTLTATGYLNGVSIGSLTTNIPSGAGRDTGIQVGIIKSVGTTSRTVDVDWVYYEAYRPRTINY